MSTSSSFFLGPGLGRWTPSGWVELREALEAGTLNESSWVELKADIAPGKRGSTELARDLASLALRSGLLIIGVRETSRGVAGDALGVELARTRDRVDQVARNTPSPPIYVEAREIPAPERPGWGVLLIGVPASGPHMVDERYWGRGDTGKTPLNDDEVRAHLTRRQIAKDDVLDQVRALEQAFPRQANTSQLPRLYVRAVPTAGRRDALAPFLGQDNGKDQIHELLADVAHQGPGPSRESLLAGAHWWRPYASGRYLSFVEPPMTPDGTDTVFRLEDCGALDLLHAPVGGESKRTWGGDTVPTVHIDSVLCATHDVLGVTGRIGDQHASYPGEWIIAIRVDLLEGRCDKRTIVSGLMRNPVAYTGQADYEAATETTTAELVEQPWAVTSRLVARLIRAVDAESCYLPFEPGSTAAALVR